MTDLLKNTYYLALDASFWLVIGLFIGGLFKTLIPTSFLQKHLSEEGFSSVIKAAILGAPLPLCSCGVIPAAMGLREAGASKSATTSFLVSTPETGVDSVFITYAMMGPFMAIVRPIAALVSAITTGALVIIFDNKDTENNVIDNAGASSCCESKKEVQEIETTSCCSAKHIDEKVKETWLSKIMKGIKYAFTELLDNIIFWLVIGIIFAALVETFVPSDILIKYGTGWTGMLLMLLVGIPMYVCATASTPLAAGFLMAGISPGAVLVFLLAGPATNMATLGIINKQMGNKTMLLYLTGIMSTALVSGFIVNELVLLWQVDLGQYLSGSHTHVSSILQIAALVLLLIMSTRKFFIPTKTQP